MKKQNLMWRSYLVMKNSLDAIQQPPTMAFQPFLSYVIRDPSGKPLPSALKEPLFPGFGA